MIDTSIITGQELIAEFMQLKSFEKDSLQYETSWDWLMPVVHKILNTTEPEKTDYEYFELEKTTVGQSIDYVYMKVVEFLKRQKRI